MYQQAQDNQEKTEQIILQEEEDELDFLTNYKPDQSDIDREKKALLEKIERVEQEKAAEELE